MKQKKLLYLATTVYPSISASALQNAKMCDAFSRMGYDVTLVAYSICSSNHSQLCNEIRNSYCLENDFKIQLNTKPTGFYTSLFSLWKTIFLARLNKTDLVFTRDLRAAYVATMMGKKTIYEAHYPSIVKKSKWVNAEEVPRFDKEIKRDEKILFKVGHSKNTVGFVVINNFLKSYFEKSPDIETQKIFLARCSSNAFECGNNIQKLQGNHAVNIGYTGRLFKGKGMEIISPLADQCPDHGFHIVGGSEEEVEEWKAKCKKSSNIFFYGYQPHKDIGGFLNAFDIVLLPNQKDVILPNSYKNIGQSTSPLKSFEYMAAKKIIIASDVPALSEFLVHGKNALLCNPGEIEEWKSAIDEVSMNIEKKRFLAENAYSDFVKNYTLSKRIRSIISHAKIVPPSGRD